jgi:hypothetical protein
MPDDHSKLVPPLPIPNRTVKRLSADDSADSRVKVGHRQAITALKCPTTYVVGHLSLQILFRIRDGSLRADQRVPFTYLYPVLCWR